jgi:hypothetical protein
MSGRITELPPAFPFHKSSNRARLGTLNGKLPELVNAMAVKSFKDI